MSSSSYPRFAVFISHAGEDKATIAIPLREKLKSLNISAFVDDLDIPPGVNAEEAMTAAMEGAEVAVIVLSPEFVPRKWPMKELMCFQRRHEEQCEGTQRCPAIIPFFYRLSVAELYQEPQLGRTDENGQNLYRKSRFHERMQAGEPEANIPTVKAALQKLHKMFGVRNDVDATNDSSYTMSMKRDYLLTRLCAAVSQAILRDSNRAVPSLQPQPAAQPASDMFGSHFANFYCSAELMFKFYDGEGAGYASSTEGRILEKVVEDTPNAGRLISVLGIAGVGKTTLLKGISSLDQVKKRFRDGMHYVALGMDATQRSLINALADAVQECGGRKMAVEIRKENYFRQVMHHVRSWFASKQCLFIFDDVWKSGEISESIIHDCFNLHTCRRDSKVVFTTRSLELGSRAQICFTMEPRQALASESRQILIQYSSLEPDTENVEENRVFNEVLEKCAGLPLFLAISGRSVKALSFRRGCEGCAAYHAYLAYLRVRSRPLLQGSVDSYFALADRLKISLKLLEERANTFGVPLRLPIDEMHRRLSVLTRQTRAPMNMLTRLWQLENKDHTAVVALEFSYVGLADVDFRTTPSGPEILLRLHDSVYEFALEQTRENQEEKSAHERLLTEYGRTVEAKQSYRMWWSINLEPDGYIHENLCRHLMFAQCHEELIALLLRPEWIARSICIRQVADVEVDFNLCISLLSSSPGEEVENTGSSSAFDSHSCAEILEALQLILEALKLSCLSVDNNSREIWFQMHGRLLPHRKRFPAIRKYVSWIGKKAPKPRITALSSFLHSPGDADARVSNFDEAVQCKIVLEDSTSIFCMNVMKDGQRVACGCGDGTVMIINLVGNRRIERDWHAHENVVSAIASGSDGKRLVSGSHDETVKVWDLHSYSLVATFGGQTGQITCIAMMYDEDLVLYGSSNGAAQLCNIATKGLKNWFQGHAGSVNCIAAFPERETLVTAAEDATMRIWNTRDGTQMGSEIPCHLHVVRSLAVSAGGSLIVTGSEFGELRIWDVATRANIGKVLNGHTSSVNSVDVNSDIDLIISGSSDETIRIWDIQTERQICEPLMGHTSSVTSVSFLPNGNYVLSSSEDGTLRLWKLPHEIISRAPERHERAVTCVEFTQDGACTISGSEDATLRIWDPKTAKHVGEPLRGHMSDVTGVSVMPGGKLVVSVSLDDKLRIWDLDSQICLHTISCNTGMIHCVSVMPAGDHAVTGSSDKTVRVWDIIKADGTHFVLTGHNASVRKLFISEDGLRIISAASDGEILVWDIQARLQVMRVTKENSWRLSKREIMDAVLEDLPHGIPLSVTPGRDAISRREVLYGEGDDRTVLATLDFEVRDCVLFPDKKTLCLGLDNGNVGFAKVEI